MPYDRTPVPLTLEQTGGPPLLGGQFDDAFVQRIPPPPTDVRISVLGNVITAKWRGPRTTPKSGNNIENWAVIIASDTAVGGSSSDPDFGNTVADAGRVIDSKAPVSNGIYESSISFTGFPTGWVIIVAYNLVGQRGRPSAPVLVDLTGVLSLLPPPDALGFSMGYDVSRYNSIDTFNVYVSAIPPADLSLFGGWHLHLSGYNALTQWMEVASLQTRSSDSGITRFEVNMPMEGGQGNGVATFTGTAVAKVSGDNFNAAWVGRAIYVRDVTTGKTGVTNVIAVASTVAMTLGAALTNGTWTYRVLNTLTFKLVSISRNGVRDPDMNHAGIPTLVV